MTSAPHTEASRAPLSGRSVVVTRSRAQAGALVDRLEAVGAEVLVWPVIDIIDPEDWAPADRAIDALSTYEWVVFTSANTVERFFARMADKHQLDARALSGVAVAAVGKATAACLGEHGIRPEFVPSKFVAEGVLEGFIERGIGPGSRVLIPRALEAREILPDTLRERGAHVDVVPCYRTVRGSVDPEIAARFAGGSVDAVTFTSPSTLRHLLGLLAEATGREGAELLSTVVKASIGPVTTDALRAEGLDADVEADPHTVAGLVDGLVARYARD